VEVLGPGVPGSLLVGEPGNAQVVAVDGEGDLVGAAPFQVEVADALRCAAAGNQTEIQ
jgi:hypothetical protein